MNTYTNWRDYAQRFRDLLSTGGHLRLRGKTLHVELKPLPQPRYQEAAQTFVQKLKGLIPTTFGIGPFRINLQELRRGLGCQPSIRVHLRLSAAVSLPGAGTRFGHTGGCRSGKEMCKMPDLDSTGSSRPDQVPSPSDTQLS